MAVALAEFNDEDEDYDPPRVDVYDLDKSKLLQSLNIPHVKMEADSFMRVKFTADGVYVAALSDHPDYVMYYFKWRERKVQSYVEVTHPPKLPGPVMEVMHARIITPRTGTFINFSVLVPVLLLKNKNIGCDFGSGFLNI